MFEFLCIYSSILTFIFAFCLWKLFVFSKWILRTEEDLENAIEALDLQKGEIEKILEIDVFFDSIEVRSVIEAIKSSRDVIINVANNLGKK